MTEAGERIDAPAIPGTPTKQKAVVGRTPWDAVVDIARLLGNAAPYVVIVGLGVFGFLKFQEVYQQRDADLRKAQADATKNYEEQLRVANEALVKTYNSLGTISGTQIKNLADMLDLHSKATARTQELSLEHEKLKKQAEEQKVRSDQAVRDLEAAAGQKMRIEGDRKNLEESLARDRAELKDLQAALKSGKRNLTDTATQVSVVRERMIELARAVRDRRSDAVNLAGRILKEESVGIVSGENEPQALRDLIGRSEADALNYLRSEPRFLFVIRMPPFRFRGGNPTFLVGSAYNNNVFRMLDQLESDGARIVSSSVEDVLFGAILPSEDDWNSLESDIFLAGENHGTRIGALELKSEWDLTALRPIEIIKNMSLKPRYLTLEQIDKEEPDLIKYVAYMKEVEVGMHQRSKEFDASILLESINIPADLRRLASRLFNAAVKRQPQESSPAPSDQPAGSILGKAAAVVLHSDFKFVSAKPSGTATGEGKGASSILLVGQYTQGITRARVANFLFSKSEGGTWKFEDLTTADRESSPVAEK